MNEIRTPLGAVIKVSPAPEHLGDGALLRLSMADPRDHRAAEVYLSPENKAELREALE